jgi:hypothetical protein
MNKSITQQAIALIYPKFKQLRVMRVVREIPHPDIKITIFHWNNRYLIKLEAGAFEQTYKISEFDIASEEDVVALLDGDFIAQALTRFNEMAMSLAGTVNRHE